MSKRKHNKEIVILTTLFIASVLTFAAGSLGTYAWYSYNARASAMYNGAAIGDGGSLQVGIFSNVEIPKLESFSGIRRDDSGSIAKHVYWSNGGFSEDQIAAYAETMDYAVDTVSPTTTGQFELGKSRDIKILAAPEYQINNANVPAKKEYYLYLPLAFRYGSYRDFSIQLSGLTMKTEDNISKSVRVGFVDEYYGSAFIVNPSSMYDGRTKVCGNLDLNKDKFYDFFASSEIIYGYHGDVTTLGRYAEDIYPEGEFSTFNGIHCRGVTGYEFEPLYADYLSLYNVLNSKVIANSNGSGYCQTGVYIYLEGWDYSCVDEGIGGKFKLDFEFNATEGE